MRFLYVSKRIIISITDLPHVWILKGRSLIYSSRILWEKIDDTQLFLNHAIEFLFFFGFEMRPTDEIEKMN